jgi:hypothetical protein
MYASKICISISVLQGNLEVAKGQRTCRFNWYQIWNNLFSIAEQLPHDFKSIGIFRETRFDFKSGRRRISVSREKELSTSDQRIYMVIVWQHFFPLPS